jgi:hypothetical protein
MLRSTLGPGIKISIRKGSMSNMQTQRFIYNSILSAWSYIEKHLMHPYENTHLASLKIDLKSN